MKKNLFLLLISTALALVSCVVVLKSFEVVVGAHHTNMYLAEPRPKMWIEDSTMGYRNRPDVESQSFAGIKSWTNDAGFRTERDHPVIDSKSGYRVIGVGDSVMWGTRVNLEDSFIYMLRRHLEAQRDHVEIINAGVVGYSTMQEAFFMAKHVVKHHPDLVVVNFCHNDWLPTENPFENIRKVVLDYMNTIHRMQKYNLTDLERESLKEFIVKMQNEEGGWKTFLREANKDDVIKVVVRKVLLEIPMFEMGSLARRHNFRLLYVFIPQTYTTPFEIELEKTLQTFMEDNGIEYISMRSEMGEFNAKAYFERDADQKGIFHWLTKFPISNMFDAMKLKSLDPVKRLQNIGRWKAVQNTHKESLYIDEIGHPSIKGNRLIAKKIADYLAHHPK